MESNQLILWSKKLLFLSFLFFISFNAFGQKKYLLKKLPADFGNDGTTLVFKIKEEKLEKKKNGKIKMNANLSFNNTIRKMIGENHYKGIILTLNDSEIKEKVRDNPEEYRYIISYNYSKKLGREQMNGIQFNERMYKFYLLDITTGNSYYYGSTSSPGSENYKQGARVILKRLEKEKSKRK